MELKTPISQTKTQIDTINRVEFINQILTVHFNKRIQIGDELSDEIFDNSPVVLVVSEEINKALEVIFLKAFESRQKLLTTITDSEIIEYADYKGFYNGILTTNFFAVTRNQAGENLQVNAAYSDFALALTNAVAGNETPIAMQICLNNILYLVKDLLVPQDLQDLRNLLAKYKIPILVQ